MTCPGISWDILGFRKTQDIQGYPRICTYDSNTTHTTNNRCVFFSSGAFLNALSGLFEFSNLQVASGERRRDGGCHWPGRASPHVESNSRLKSNTRANKQKTGDDQKQFVGSEKRTS